MTVCFIGHRKIKSSDALKDKIYQVVVELIQNGTETFLFGSRSEFDELCLAVVTDIQKKYPHIKRVYVRARHQYIDKSYEEYLLESYDETYFPARIHSSGRSSYVERNQEMIDRSCSCVFFFDKDYISPPRRQKSPMPLPDRKRNSGTKLAFDYAVTKKKRIINLFNHES